MNVYDVSTVRLSNLANDIRLAYNPEVPHICHQQQQQFLFKKNKKSPRARVELMTFGYLIQCTMNITKQKTYYNTL